MTRGHKAAGVHNPPAHDFTIASQVRNPPGHPYDSMMALIASLKNKGLLQKPQRWIKTAIAHPGALTRSAKRVGETPMEFAREHAHSNGITGHRARLALTLSKLRNR